MQHSKRYDLLIAGAGILGLWIAREATRRGLSIAIVDAGPAPGAGASGTPLAVLLPHLPDRTEPKRVFQRDALVTLGDEIADLERETGTLTGYARRGRVMPIRKESFLAKAQSAVAGARLHWDVPGDPKCEILQSNGTEVPLDGWLDPGSCPLGVLHDTLSGAIQGDAYLAALTTAASRTAEIHWGHGLARYDTTRHVATDQTGTALPSADAIVITAGFGSFAFLDRQIGRPTGDGVKGHAATFRLSAPMRHAQTRPVLYDNGIYVVQLNAETVSIGSTTEYEWSDALPSKKSAARMIDRAKDICVPLRTATQTGLWAGIRPRAVTRNPLVGALPGHAGLYVATGGYKITFGIAHRLAACLVDEIVEGAKSTRLPDAFHASALAAENR